MNITKKISNKLSTEYWSEVKSKQRSDALLKKPHKKLETKINRGSTTKTRRMLKIKIKECNVINQLISTFWMRPHQNLIKTINAPIIIFNT